MNSCVKATVKAIAFLITLSVLVSCASARVVTVEPGQGGIIAVNPKDSSDAREKAVALMSENCRGKYKIVKEGEEVVGQTSQSQTTAGRSLFNKAALNTSSNSTNKTEWRITYKCGA